jgi:hypothetical protein
VVDRKGEKKKSYRAKSSIGVGIQWNLKKRSPQPCCDGIQNSRMPLPRMEVHIALFQHAPMENISDFRQKITARLGLSLSDFEALILFESNHECLNIAPFHCKFVMITKIQILGLLGASLLCTAEANSPSRQSFHI